MARITATGEGGAGRLRARAGLTLILVAIGALAFLACDESEVVPPSGSEINISANPATLVFTGTSVPQSVIRARVTNSLGISLPGQTVVFDSTEGVLDPQALTPIETDGDGIAMTVLATVRTATVTAISGTVSDQLTITVLLSDLQDILLNGENTLSNCNDVLSFTAQAVDTTGAPVSGVTINFELRDGTGLPGSTPGLAGTFSPSQGITDSNGEVDTDWFPDINDCTTKCANGQSCDNTTSVVAFDQTGLFESTPIKILDAIP
jgi:hypothetical protein